MITAVSYIKRSEHLKFCLTCAHTVHKCKGTSLLQLVQMALLLKSHAPHPLIIAWHACLLVSTHTHTDSILISGQQSHVSTDNPRPSASHNSRFLPPDSGINTSKSTTTTSHTPRAPSEEVLIPGPSRHLSGVVNDYRTLVDENHGRNNERYYENTALLKKWQQSKLSSCMHKHRKCTSCVIGFALLLFIVISVVGGISWLYHLGAMRQIVYIVGGDTVILGTVDAGTDSSAVTVREQT